METRHYLELKNKIEELDNKLKKLERREGFVKSRLSPEERKMANMLNAVYNSQQKMNRAKSNLI